MIEKKIAENIEKISGHFDLNLQESNKCYIGCCPIHGGDNPSAFNFYHIQGHTTVGNWKCNTQGCEQEFGANAIGFIRGLLSAKKYDWSVGSTETVSFQDALLWCQNFLGIKGTYTTVDKTTISYAINRIYSKNTIKYELNIPVDRYEKSGLQFPAEYFINRGYNRDTLLEFNVGYCADPSKPMYTRAVVPLHTPDGNSIIGCLGRSTWEQCKICNCYHNPNSMCPAKEKRGIYCKWKNSKAFPSSSELYNIHRAKSSIETTGLVILTEGSPNVWRLFEAGFPMSLGCFGSKFSPDQKKVLDSTGAHTIIIVPDAGAPGQLMVQKIIELCKNCYNIVTIEPSYDDDIGECNIDTVKTILSPFIEKYKQ